MRAHPNTATAYSRVRIKVPLVLAPEVSDDGPSREDTAMIRLIGAAAVGLLCWLSVAAAQTAPAAAVEELVLANRILNDRGVLDAYGHISIRHPADPKRYLMARAVAPGLVSAEDIVEFDLDSTPVDRRDRSMFVERFIHGEAYKSRPDVNA